jgi:hypothetical protein
MDIENRFPSVTFEVFADETDEVFADETETTDHSGQKFVEEKMLAARLLRELFDFLRPYLASRKEDEKFNFSNYVDFKDLLFGRLGVQTDPEDQSILQSTQHEALVNEDFFEWLQRWWKKNKNPDLDSCEEFLQRTFRLPSYEKEKD